MTDEIYLIIDGEQHGPFDRSMLTAKLKRGEISRSTWAWQPNLDEWVALGTLLHVPPDIPAMRNAHELAQPPDPPTDKDTSFVMREAAGCLRGIYIVVIVFAGLFLLLVLMAMFGKL